MFPPLPPASTCHNQETINNKQTTRKVENYVCRSPVAIEENTKGRAREKEKRQGKMRTGGRGWVLSGDTWDELKQIKLDFSKVAPPPKAQSFPLSSVNTDLTDMWGGNPCCCCDFSSVLNPRTLWGIFFHTTALVLTTFIDNVPSMIMPPMRNNNRLPLEAAAQIHCHGHRRILHKCRNKKKSSSISDTDNCRPKVAQSESPTRSEGSWRARPVKEEVPFSQAISSALQQHARANAAHRRCAPQQKRSCSQTPLVKCESISAIA